MVIPETLSLFLYRGMPVTRELGLDLCSWGGSNSAQGTVVKEILYRA